MSTGIPKLDNLIDRLETIPVNAFIARSLDENKEIVEDLIGLQHEAGIDGTGKRIKPEYTQTTIRIKKGKGQPTDRVTLKDEGDFRKGITQRVRKNRADIFGRDPKTEALKDKYGPEILDHTEESKKEIQQQILPDLQLLTKKYVLNE